MCDMKQKGESDRREEGENDRKRKLKTIFLERTGEGHRQSDKHWNCLKGNIGKTSERRGGAHMGFSECIDTSLN